MDPTDVQKQIHHAPGDPPAFIAEPPATGRIPEINGHVPIKPHNFSIQTGEEFSLDFIRDKVLPKKPLAPENNGYTNGASAIMGIGQNSSSDSTVITVKRIPSKASNVEMAQGASKISPTHKEKENSNRKYCKMLKAMCSFHGKILPRPSDGKLRYVGGHTHIIQVPNEIQWVEFKQKMAHVYHEVTTVKYQLPGEGIDILISVTNDEDLHNMMEEWNELHDCGSMLRIILFSERDLDKMNRGFSSSDPDTESLYVSAINEICSWPSSTVLTVESSSGNQSDALDHLSSIPVTSSQVNDTTNGKPSLFFIDPVDDVPIVENHNRIHCFNQKISAPHDAKIELNDFDALFVNEVSSQRNCLSENFPREQTLTVNRLSKSDEYISTQKSATPLRCLKAEANGNTADFELFPTPISQSFSTVYALEHSMLTAEVENRGGADILVDIGERFPPDFLSEILSEVDLGKNPLNEMNVSDPSPSDWPCFQKLEKDEFSRTDVSLIDQDHIPSVHQMVSLSPFNDERYTEPNRQSGETGATDTSFHRVLSKVDTTTLQIIKNKDLEDVTELGSGAFGTVYHGKWRGTDVAIKRLKKICFSARSAEEEGMSLEFCHETEILSKLHHPNVVAFYGVVVDGPDDSLATVTEFMVDGSLRQVILRNDDVLDRRKKLVIAMDAAFGMEYLHSKNIVHFDLKCDNLLVNLKDPQRPVCKVADFGLSKIKRQTLVSGGVRGTLPWMAPELLNGCSSQVSEKVDVFSFGVVMWEIITGEEPYANMHYGAIIGGIVNNTLRPPIPMGCDPEWSNLMEQCWAPNPASRPSFTEIAYRLRLMSASRTSTSN